MNRVIATAVALLLGIRVGLRPRLLSRRAERPLRLWAGSLSQIHICLRFTVRALPAK